MTVSRQAAWGEPQRTYERPGNQARRAAREWQAGDIAFLKHSDAFTEGEVRVLLEPKKGDREGYLPQKATGHPVIILERLSAQSTHVLITPVSAYSSSADNNYCPPWQQWAHRHKYPDYFRSFEGCERYDPVVPHLRLLPGQRMPKPKTSWVYAQSIFCVPLSVIGHFTKSPVLPCLRMCPDSLNDLISFMKTELRSSRYRDSLKLLQDKEPASSGLGRFNPVREATWRTVEPRSQQLVPSRPAVPAPAWRSQTRPNPPPSSPSSQQVPATGWVTPTRTTPPAAAATTANLNNSNTSGPAWTLPAPAVVKKSWAQTVAKTAQPKPANPITTTNSNNWQQQQWTMTEVSW
ncbi:hypothetical protein B0T16DRAFT_516132 [Cercophora newfieldiana]|uniref:Uncharacterized protein n=1 Tax=Cercophora newfieldiana TaxID=92897 RepID=A0AA39XZ90_9PEZI|nr:hypothetical protein B0T16DRAFT_516132 [Cercophora newfieldiana]